jgi:radical SAM-linked protein
MERKRYRITYGRYGAMLYVSTLDLTRIWERTIRRAGLPLSYSGGYSPRPKMQQADAMPLGIASDAELIDIWLEEAAPIGELPALLTRSAPDGLPVKDAREVPVRSPSLPVLTRSAGYVVTLPNPVPDLAVRAAALMESDEAIRERRGERENFRPLIHALAAESETRLTMRLALAQGSVARPDHVLSALGLGDVRAGEVRRTDIVLDESSAS